MANFIGEMTPAQIWHHFEKISRVPRASGQEQRILDHVLQVAVDHGLESRQDDAGNVVVVRPADPQYRKAPVVVLQSHVDMVCEKNAASSHDFDADPIELTTDGEWVGARATSLGADNGIGMAAMLSILTDPSLRLGQLECLFTVEEEIGLNGARDLDPGIINGRMLINLDSEEVGVLYVGCAGGRDSDLYLQAEPESRPGPAGPDESRSCLRLGVSGLRGGHSGVEIHLGGANAVKLMARLLNRIGQSHSMRLVSISGGDKHNAIPREAFACISVENVEIDGLEKTFKACTEELKGEFGVREPGLRFYLEREPAAEAEFDEGFTTRVIDTLMTVPHGVLATSSVMDDLVETSTNLSSVKTEHDAVHIHASHRSSVESALSWVSGMHRSIASLAGARIELDSGYPGWNPDLASPLLHHAEDGVLRATGRPAEVRAIHAGLECGVIRQKFGEMDAVSLGPTILGAHSPDERVHVESVGVFWKILMETLAQIYRGVRS